MTPEPEGCTTEADPLQYKLYVYTVQYLYVRQLRWTLQLTSCTAFKLAPLRQRLKRIKILHCVSPSPYLLRSIFVKERKKEKEKKRLFSRVFVK